MTEENTSRSPDESEKNPVAKRPYETPVLTVHGTVEELTRGVGLQNKDGLTGSELL